MGNINVMKVPNDGKLDQYKDSLLGETTCEWLQF